MKTLAEIRARLERAYARDEHVIVQTDDDRARVGRVTLVGPTTLYLRESFGVRQHGSVIPLASIVGVVRALRRVLT